VRRAPLSPAVIRVVTLLVLAGTTAVGAGAAVAAPHSGPHSSDDTVRAETQRKEAARRDGATAAERARRERSRRDFRGLSRLEALALAKRRHPAQVLPPAWRAFQVPQGHQLVGYETDFTARIATPDGSRDRLVVSNVPMRAADEQGRKRPVDLSLEPAGDAFRPVNPLVDVALGRRIRDGLALRRAGIAVRPVGGDGAVEAVLTGDTLFYADAFTDTDMLVRPDVRGFSVNLQVRSDRAPEVYALEVDLPAGATLQRVNGSIQIQRGDDVLGAITAPVAWDADGREVDVSWSIDGGRLIIDVPHVGRDLAYPLMVDPIVTDSYEWEWWGANNAGGNFANWIYGSSGAFANHGWAGGGPDASTLGAGMYIRNLGTQYYYSAGQSGWFAWRAPGYARLPKVEWNMFEHAQEQGTCMELGVAKWPVTSAHPIQGGWYPGRWESCPATAANQYVATYGGASGDQAVFSLRAGWAGYKSTFTAHVGVVYLHIDDPDRPELASGLPDGWVKSPPETPLDVWAVDTSTGIAEIRLTAPGWSGATLGPDTYTRCARTFLCPRAGGTEGVAKVSDMPEGVNNIQAMTKDPTGNLRAATATGTTPGTAVHRGAGLRGYYYDNEDFTNHVAERLDPQIDFNWSGQPHPLVGSDTFTVRWVGYLDAPETGTYTFETSTDDGARLWINDVTRNPRIDHWRLGSEAAASTTMYLTQGKHRIVLEYLEQSAGAIARLRWKPPSATSVTTIPSTRLSPPNGWQVKLDRSSPEITGFGGTLYQRAGRGANGTSYTLRVDGTDGVQNGPAAARRSGGKAVEVQIVDEDGMRTKASPPRACATDSCPLGEDFTINALELGREGPKTIRARGSDQLDQWSDPALAKFEVVVDRTAPTLDPLSGTATSGYLAAGHYDLRAVVRDPAAVGASRSSGPRDVRVKVDGQVMTTVADGNCAAGTVCRRVRLHATGPSALSEGMHTVEVVGLDNADNESAPRTLTVSVDRSSGIREHFGLYTQDLGAGHRLAVNAATGNVNLAVTDQVIEAEGLDVAITRSYNSRRHTVVGSFGPGWTLDGGRDLVLERLDDGLVRILGPSGTTAAFVPDGTTYRRVLGLSLELTRLADNRYALDFPEEGRRIYFPAAGGAATRQVDDDETGVDYVYGNGQLSSIKHDVSPTVKVENGADGIAAFDGPTNDDQYGYTLSRLTSHTGASGAASYTYDAAGRMRTVFPNGGAGRRFTYDGLGRVTEIVELSSSVAVTGPTTTITYPTSDRTVVTSPDGRQHQYTFDPATAGARLIQVGPNPPTVEVSGPLAGYEGATVPDGEHALSMSATVAPNGANPTSLALDIDGGEQTAISGTGLQTKLSASHTLNTAQFAAGEYSLDVEAAAQNGSTTLRRVRVHIATPTIVDGSPEPPGPTVAAQQEWRRDAGIEDDQQHVQQVNADAAAQARHDEYGLPLTALEVEELDFRDTLLDDADVIDDYAARATVAGDYAGLWVDHVAGGRLTVAFTENVDAHRAALQALYPHPGRLDVVLADFSLQELAAVRSQLSTTWQDPSNPALYDVVSVSTEIMENRVRVGVTGDQQAAQSALTARFGPAVVAEAVTVDAMQDRGSSSRRAEAGAEAQPFTGGRCTIGFSMVANSARRSAYHYVTTAGHCAAVNEPVSRGRVSDVSTLFLIGEVEANALREGSDADALIIATQRHRLSARIKGQRYGRRVIRTESLDEEDRDVERVSRYVCMRGVVSGIRCGNVTSTDSENELDIEDGPNYRLVDQREIDMSGGDPGCRKGDSGAPIYRHAAGRRALAVGLFSGRRGRGFLRSDRCFYSHIHNIGVRLGVKLFAK
jgi:YD repeat-containing protein